MEGVVGWIKLWFTRVSRQVINESQVHVVDADISDEDKLVIPSPKCEVSHAAACVPVINKRKTKS